MAPPLDDRGLSTEAELDALVNAFPDVGFILDTEGRYVRVLASPDSELLLYDDPEALVGRRVPEVFDDETAETIVTNIRAAVETGRRQSFEYTLDVAGGQRWFEARVAPIPDDGDHVVYVARDVTEREERRRRLARRQDYMAEMLDSLDDVFYALDCEGVLVDWNRAVETVTGYDGEELARCAVYEVFGECAAQRLRAFVDEVADTGSARRVTEVETKAGRRIPYEFVASLFEDPDGEDLVVGIGRDVSERVEREEQARVFGRVLRHNMRNKMTVIEGTAEALDRATDGELDGDVDRIRAATRDLTKLTEKAHDATDILLQESHTGPLDVDAVARDVVADSRRRFENARVTYDGDPEATASAIPAIRQALAELVENAVEHSAPHRAEPEVRLSVDVRADEVVVTVSDDGPGLPAHEANIITEERDVSPVFHPSGMGLWLVRWIVKRSHGTVELVEDGGGGEGEDGGASEDTSGGEDGGASEDRRRDSNGGTTVVIRLSRADGSEETGG